MKRIAFLAVLVLPLFLMAAAPTVKVDYVNIGEVTVDSQYTGNWDPVDTIIITSIDTTHRLTIEITGVALLRAGEALYIGVGNDSANRVDSATSATTGQTHTNLDTVIVKTPGYWFQREISVPFTYRVRPDSVADAVVDTFFLNFATGGSTQHIEIQDLTFTVTHAVSL